MVVGFFFDWCRAIAASFSIVIFQGDVPDLQGRPIFFPIPFYLIVVKLHFFKDAKAPQIF